MQKYTSIFTTILLFISFQQTFAQDSTSAKFMDEIVVTGQIKPQSLKASVYQVKTINSQRIALSGATNVQQVLNSQLGFRFSNDNILGTDVQINGMSGRNVKILLDGAPVLDRFDQRTSLSQIDINTIERVEIVEGPMSVVYGSDAMAGTINIITKKNSLHKITVAVKLQEETAGKEYHAFNYKGFHTQNINVGLNKKSWHFSAGLTQNDFAGFGGDEYGRNKPWLPKKQLLSNAKLNYKKGIIDIYYRLDALAEILTKKNKINIDYDVFARAIDQKFTTNRYLHQIQSNLNFNNQLQLSTIVAYTNFSRATETKEKDLVKNTDSLTTTSGSQDVSILSSFSIKNTLQYTISNKVAWQAGIDVNSEKASGDRIITGTAPINDVAFFTSVEYKPTTKINIRPGFRLIKNSVYKAPPIVPSINTKFVLRKNIDARLSYGYGFRAPVLRELYFEFIDVNHNIVGNKNLQAETSNSLNGSFNWGILTTKKLKLNTTVGLFYNHFKNQIELIQSRTVPTQFTYYNIADVKTTGFNVENKIATKNLEASVGLAYIARAQAFENDMYKNDTRNYLWTPEVNANIIYKLTKVKTSLGLFYKYIGTKPAFSYEQNESPVGLYLTKTSAYQLADFTATTTISKILTASAGIKNIFDVTDVRSNTIGTAGIAHNSDGPLSVGYGRSYYIGLSFNWFKK